MKKSALVPILSIVLCIAVLASVAAYVFISPFKSAVMSTFSSPSEQLRSVTTNYMSSAVSDVYTAIQSASDTFVGETQKGYKTTIKLTPSQDLLRQGDLDGVGIQSIGISNSSILDKSISSQDIILYINDAQISTTNLVVNSETGEAYLRNPDLSPSYVYCATEQVGDLSGIDFNILGGNSVDSFDFEEELKKFGINQELLNKLTEKYVEVAINSIDDVSRVVGVKGDIDGVDFTATTLTAELTIGDIAEIAIDVLKEIKTDSDVKRIIEKIYAEYEADMSGIEVRSFNEAYAEFQADIDDSILTLEEDLESVENTPMNMPLLRFVFWINNSNELMGCEVESLIEDNNSSFGLMTIDNDENSAIEQWLIIEDEIICKTLGSVEKSKNGALTGSFSFTMTGEKNMGVKFNDFLVNEENAQVTGSMTLSYDDGYEKSEIKFDSSVEEKIQNAKLSIVIDGDDYLSIELTNEEIPFTSCSIPSYDYTVEEMDEYLESCDVDGFLSGLESKLDDDLYSLLSGIFTGGNVDISYIDNVEGMTYEAAYDYLIENGINSYDISFEYVYTDNVYEDGIILDVYYFIDSYNDTCVELFLGNYSSRDTYEEYDYLLNLSELSLNVNGVETGFPFAYSLLKNIDETDLDKTINYGYWEWVDVGNYFSFTVANQSEHDVIDLHDGVIDYLNYSESTSNEITICGIGIGTNISALSQYFADEIDEDYSGVVTIYVAEENEPIDEFTIEFYFSDGICESINISCYDYVVYDDGTVEFL